ncbi:FecR domain-containing protein [Pseudomonas syringae]|nr:FecR domain-containing protein [Pseudomonas syringae]MBD8573835.1 FecR domain-containing protein [Pseudomonas syringae]MBD8790199.1 FecR domain-containing protein [Pseudomonas syringae]MBD8803799.1 FecR domain-containing protein [Pseudomonas syringae]MBD8810129.1 FecR domain-containing protein [Pseudomonas syringae]
MNPPGHDHARQVAHAAARWLALVESGTASAEDRAGLQHWREQSPSHEQMWQKAQGLRQRFADVPPQLAMASLDRPAVELQRRTLIKRALGVAALLPAGWLLSGQAPVAAWRADLRTGTGEQRTVRLADASLLQLNTATAVNLDWQAGRHRLELVEGELALNMVETAPALTLQTRLGQVVATGAQLCLREDAGRCRVSVSRGQVELHPLLGAPVRLQGGQRASLGGAGVSAVERFDAQQPDWRTGVLTVENRPLGSFLTELSRYRRGVLRWDPRLEALRVTGAFRLDDTDRVLQLLAASLPLDVQTHTRYWVTLVPHQAG